MCTEQYEHDEQQTGRKPDRAAGQCIEHAERGDSAEQTERPDRKRYQNTEQDGKHCDQHKIGNTLSHALHRSAERRLYAVRQRVRHARLLELMLKNTAHNRLCKPFRSRWRQLTGEKVRSGHCDATAHKTCERGECAASETKDQIDEHDREDHEIGHVKQAEKHIRNLLRLHRLLPPWTARSGQ